MLIYLLHVNKVNILSQVFFFMIGCWMSQKKIEGLVFILWNDSQGIFCCLFKGPQNVEKGP